ncbi:Piwi domain-containing protein [Spirosoma soli]|uniref:Protein argonaute n=1 Tax=Spirosoma soli TaxID=1770529 RepID=A0ABW5LY90_9BACT
MVVPIVTSKTGILNQISIHKYAFSEEYKTNSDKRNKFISWLEHQCLYELAEDYFTLLQPLQSKSNSQYEHLQSVYIAPPFANTTKISSYLGHLLRTNLSSFYKQFLNYNTFVVEGVNFLPFKLLKAFEFNIEVFTDGVFLIHFLPVSKIVSNTQLTSVYLNNLKTALVTSNVGDLEINVISLDKFKSRKFRIIEDFDRITQLTSGGKYVGTFDYHFLATFSPEIFAKITECTVKEINKSLHFLREVMQKVKLPDFIEFSSTKEFTKIDTNIYSNQSNLLIGGNFACKEHKAAFYKGVFQPVNGKCILPVYAGSNIKLNMFEELFGVFNQGGADIQILQPIQLQPEENSFIDFIKSLRTKYKENLLIIVFTEFKLPKTELKSLQKLGIQTQIYLGRQDKYQMSNFVVKCIEKLGGILSVIRSTKEPNTTYFLGIDLGHSTQEGQKTSNLAMVLFSYQGVIIKKSVNKNIPRNEALTVDAIERPLKDILTFLKKKKLPLPNKLIIHRDGKLHKYDIDNILTKISELFDIDCVDIVEVIKSGYPVIAKYDSSSKSYINWQSGEAWVLTHQKYAIMVTNTQVEEQGRIINPIIIKYKLGQSDFENILFQIYWFTKIYTNGLYNSTRLPATTLKANNIVSTSTVTHISSNLG